MKESFSELGLERSHTAWWVDWILKEGCQEKDPEAFGGRIWSDE